MEGIDLEVKVARYGPSQTHWWPLSVSAQPIEPVLQPPTVTSSATIDTDTLAAQSVSTYPVFDGGSRRDGDPIADVYVVKIYDNAACFGLADGCGWGPRSFKAASKAVEGFSEYVDSTLSSVTTIREASRFLLRAICSAHEKIWDKASGQKSWECGSTTFLGALLLKVTSKTESLDSDIEVEHDEAANRRSGGAQKKHRASKTDREHAESGGEEEEEEEKDSSQSKKKKKQQRGGTRLNQASKKENLINAPYVLVCANIGDCKAFVVSGGDEPEAIDVTVESKKDVKDRCDPGGRIGPYLDGHPDTRNLIIASIPVWPGDKICLVSDGVHDNLDPETLGLSLELSIRRNPTLAQSILSLATKETDDPSSPQLEIPAQYSDNKAWEALPLHYGELFKTEYREFLLSKFIREGANTPQQLIDKLFDHCSETTKASRQYMEQNPSHVHPPDYVTYPGKMDHTTCIVYVVPGTPPPNRPGMERSVTVESSTTLPNKSTTSTPTELPPRAKKGKKTSTSTSSPGNKQSSPTSSPNTSPRHTTSKGGKSSNPHTPRKSEEHEEAPEATPDGVSTPTPSSPAKKSRKKKNSVKNSDLPLSSGDDISPRDAETSKHSNTNGVSPSKAGSGPKEDGKRRSKSETTNGDHVVSTDAPTAGQDAIATSN